MCYMDKKDMCDAKVSPVRPDTSSSYLRKIKKPLIERKRRERINNCLSQLKSILLENIKQNGGTQVSKLDKADILEMTVSHLRQIHHQQLSAAMASSSSVIAQFREGYTECATETVRYMEASRAYPAEMVMRMRHNLAGKVGYTRDFQAHARLAFGAATDFATPRDCTPVKVKVESVTSPTKSASPDSGFDSAFSPLLMTVPVKLETEREVNKTATLNSSSDSSMYFTSSSNTTLDTSAEQCSTSDTSLENTSGQSAENSECKPSQSAVLALPSRVPASVGGSPPQKQVWRPF